METFGYSLIHDTYTSKLEKINAYSFSRREIDVISCILAARSAKKTASILAISPKTVETHIYNIMTRLGINSREKLVDHIEKSGKLQFIRRHYQELMVQTAFVNRLKTIITLHNIQFQNCQIVHYLQQGDSSLISLHLTKYLGFFYKETKIVNKAMHYTAYHINIDLDKTNSITLLLVDNEVMASQLKVVWPGIKTIITSKYSNFYMLFFDIIQVLMPHLSLETHISAFRNECRQFDESNLQEINNHTDISSLKDNHNKYLNKKPYVVYTLLIIFLLFFSLLNFNFIGSESAPSQAKSSFLSSNIEVENLLEESKNLIKETHEYISKIDILEIKPRILLLNEDPTEFLRVHQNIEDSLSDYIKKVDKLREKTQFIQESKWNFFNFLTLFSNSNSYTSSLVQNINHDLFTQREILRIVLLLNRGILLYMSNTTYPPNEQPTSNYERAMEEFVKSIRIIHSLAKRANLDKYIQYLKSLDTFIVISNNDKNNEHDYPSNFKIDDSKILLLDKAFVVSLNNCALILRSQGDIGDASMHFDKSLQNCIMRIGNNRLLTKKLSETEANALCKFYLHNDFSQRVFREARQALEISNKFREDYLLPVNFEPRILTQIGDLTKRIISITPTSPGEDNVNKSIEIYKQAYLKNSEDIVVLNGYGKAHIDLAEIHIRLAKIEERKIKAYVNLLDHASKELGFPILNASKTKGLDDGDIYLQLKKDIIENKQKVNTLITQEFLQHLNGLEVAIERKNQFTLEVSRCFDIAERSFRYALEKCDRGNAILEVNLAYLYFVKNFNLKLGQNSKNEISEIIKKIQGGKKDDHKILLFYKACLQLILGEYKPSLDTLRRYEYLGGNLTNPYILFIRALAKFGLKDFKASNKDFNAALDMNSLQGIYFTENKFMPVVRFDGYVLSADEFVSNVCSSIKILTGKDQNEDQIGNLHKNHSSASYFIETLERCAK